VLSKKKVVLTRFQKVSPKKKKSYCLYKKKKYIKERDQQISWQKKIKIEDYQKLIEREKREKMHLNIKIETSLES